MYLQNVHRQVDLIQEMTHRIKGIFVDPSSFLSNKTNQMCPAWGGLDAWTRNSCVNNFDFRGINTVSQPGTFQKGGKSSPDAARQFGFCPDRMKENYTEKITKSLNPGDIARTYCSPESQRLKNCATQLECMNGDDQLLLQCDSNSINGGVFIGDNTDGFRCVDHDGFIVIQSLTRCHGLDMPPPNCTPPSGFDIRDYNQNHRNFLRAQNYLP